MSDLSEALDLREGEKSPTRHHSGMAEAVDAGHVIAGSAVKSSTELALPHPAGGDHLEAQEQLHGIEMHAIHGGVIFSSFTGGEQVPIDTNMDTDEGMAIHLPCVAGNLSPRISPENESTSLVVELNIDHAGGLHDFTKPRGWGARIRQPSNRKLRSATSTHNSDQDLHHD